MEGKTKVDDPEGAARRGPERALSEKSPSVMEELVIECKSGAESGITESKPSSQHHPQVLVLFYTFGMCILNMLLVT